MNNKTSLQQLQEKLKEMFQFQNNDLNFGIYKIFKIKQKEIETFIDNSLEEIVKKELKNISNNEQKASLLELELFLKQFNQEKLLEDINGNYEKIEGFINIGGNGKTEKLKEILKSQRNANIKGDLENKIYNYILNFFEFYYSDGDFGYNTRSIDTYKVEYDEDYNGSDIMFHWKHKGSYYIKTGNGFNSIKFNLDGKNIIFILETNKNSEEEISQNNNKDDFKHYEFNRIEKVGESNYKVIFNLARTSTPKEEIFKSIFKEIFDFDLDDKFLFTKDGKNIFNNLTKDFQKIQDGNIKGFKQLKIKKDDLLKKYNTNFGRGEKLKAKIFDELDKNNEKEKTLINLWSLDQKLNSFYIGNDSDFFIHKDLKGFLTKEKEKFIKNNILGDLDTILNAKIDNTALVIAKTFNNISSKIIDFLSAVEEFQKHIFEMKKKVLVSEYCITLDKIDESFYEEILENKEQIKEWKKLGFIEEIDIQQGTLVTGKEYLKNNQTLNIDTKFFSKDFKDKILANIDNLENELNGTLINSENFQALNLLKNKYRGKIKCIYIDPPYNTGGDGFIYKDSFKHSSWLSMMNDRLILAKELLTEDGVIFVSIDDNEQDNLKKLMNQIFGNENFVANLIWKKKAGGGSDSKYYTIDHEYVLLYSKNIEKLENLFMKMSKKQKEEYKYKDNNFEKFGKFKRKNLYQSGIDVNRPNLRYEIIAPDNTKILPPTIWRWSKEKFKKEFNEGKIDFVKNSKGEWQVYTKMYLYNDNKERKIKPRSILNNYGFTRDGNIKIKNLFNKLLFNYSKPINLIIHFLETITNKNDIILDFFSGSGTTQQAVIELNKEDGGNRKYIGVEMGEYFDSVTKSRVQKVIYSSNWKNGKPENNKGVSQIFKYQVLEQYEDVLDKLEKDKENFPKGLDLRYLYKKEKIKLGSNLDLRKPFNNKYIYGKAKKETSIDLVETYNYLQGHNIDNIKTYEFQNKYYKVIKIGNKLVIWRNIEIAENDIKNIKKIVRKYDDIDVLEVNVEIYSLERDKFGMLEIGGKKYDVEIIDESLFNE